MANVWHFTVNGQPASAPVSWAQLKQLATAGRLEPTDKVWREDMTSWELASSIKGLFPLSKLPPVPAPVKKELTKKDAKKTDEYRVLGASASTEPAAGLTEMNPYLALLLTICTGGLFGLFYASRVSSAYAKRAAARKTDAANRTLGRARHPVAVMVLSYLTGGIYFSYWTYRVMQECGVYTSGRACESRSEKTLMLCFPPYAAYTALFRLPDLVKAVRKTAAAPEFSALGAVPFFLNPCMWPLMPFLAMIYQDALNQVWFTAP
jgi:GYF domain 2